MKRLVLLLALLKCLRVSDSQNLNADGKISRCHVFGNYGVKTFGNDFYHFSSSCGYTLAQFSNKGDPISVKLIDDVVYINVDDKSYELKKTAKQEPLFKSEIKTYTLPAKENDIEASKAGTYLTAKFAVRGFTVKWDLKSFVVVEVDTNKNDDLSGICSNTEKTSVDSWSEPSDCSSQSAATCIGTPRASSLSYCRQIISDSKYRRCLKVLPDIANNFLTICIEQYCNCKATNKNDCLCGVVEALSKTCSFATDKPVEWRKPNFCPMKCPPGQEYRDCGQRQKACGEPDNIESVKCTEGCQCGLQLYLHDRKCIPVIECPCYYDGKNYPPKSSVSQDCKVCVCDHNNKWICPPGPPCMEEAVVWGDPHYVTFDKKHYDFMGKCTYYLVKGIDFTIKADHYVWEHGKYVKNYNSGAPSYTKVLYLEYDAQEVVLKPGPVATANGAPINRFPYVISGITVSKPAARKIIVEFPNLVEVHWDGDSVVKVRVPTTMRGRLTGLLGNFNKNPNDDFMLPDGTIVSDPNTFGHSWLVDGTCEDENTDPVPHPCHSNPAQKQLAEKACAPLKTNLFTNCKEHDAKLSHESCIYDCCLVAASQGEKCACTNLADYADKCSIQQWRKSVPVCEIPCPKGQIYNYCINPCESSCEYLNLNKDCNKRCIEGCSCPAGQTFNEENECVPIEKCKCKLNGKYFPAGFKYLKEGNTLQTCNRGKWVSSQINPGDAKQHTPLTDLQTRCNKKKNADYTACKNPTPMTCKNMHNYQKTTIQTCTDGCECNEGFVLDTTTDICVTPESCPCFYNGQSYENNAARRDFNKKCMCKGNDWQCIPYINRVDKCSLFGDTHVRNLDGKLISFKSTCEYILAQPTLDKKSFSITTKNGDITISYTGSNEKSHKVTIRKDGNNFGDIGDMSDSTTDFKSSKTAELKDIGLKLVWNREGWFHVHFDNRWKNKIEGFCAHSEDPSKAINDDDVKLLTNTWSIDQACFDVTLYNPTKEVFAEDDTPVPTKCELLKSKKFNPCNKELSIDDYYSKCLVVARDFMLNEDEDGAEEFYCQIFSALAQECNDVGIPVNWRSKDQCPFECGSEGTKYSTCVSTCTCDIINESQNNMCKDSSCVEGCVTTVCPAETVYSNDTLTECVSVEECAQIKCMIELKNQPSNCVCVKGKISCTTTPSSTTVASTTPRTPTPQSESQKDLSDIFTKINRLLHQIKNPTIIEAIVPLSKKDEQIVSTFSEHMKTLEKEILCYASLSDRSKCVCENEEKEVCAQNEVQNRARENDIRIQNKLDLLKLVESHLRCLLSVEKGCACVNGEKICKNDQPISKMLIYTYVVNGEKHVVKYFYYLQKAKRELKCLANLKKMPLDNCICINGQLTCSFDEQIRQKENEEAKTELLGRYSKEVEEHLRCYARLKLDAGHCWCEGAKKICLESHTPLPADNRYEIIEHYLPNVVNTQQMDIGFTEDVECVKTLTDDKCSCVDGKKICDTPSIVTTPLPATTRRTTAITSPSPTTIRTTTELVVDLEHLLDIQMELLNGFNNIQEQFVNFLETELTGHVSPRELETIKIFKDYISQQETDISCLIVLSDFGRCKCIEGQETCSSEDTKEHLPHNNIQMNNYMALIRIIEAHLACLLNKELENPTCVCVNAQQICPDNANAPTRTKIVYENAIEKDKSTILLYYVLNLATPELKCLSEDVNSKTTTCSNGKRITVPGRDPNEVIKSNAKKISIYTAYINKVQEQLLCHSRLEHDGCRCEEGKQICPEKVPVVPQNNKFLTVEKYVKSPINPKQIYQTFENDIDCLENLKDEDTQNGCICKDGKKICSGADQEVPPEEDTLLDDAFSFVQDVTKRIACLTTKKSGCTNEDHIIAVPSRDKLQLKVYGPYINFIKTQLACMRNKRENCSCLKGKPKCPGVVSKEDEASEVKLYQQFLEHIDSQLTCLLQVQRKSSSCICVNGKEICENKKRPYIVYPTFDTKVLAIRNNDQLYNYIELQLKCFKNIEDKSIPCNCKNGAKTCETPVITKVPEKKVITDQQRDEISQSITTIETTDTKRKCFEKTKNMGCFKDSTSSMVTTVKLPTKDIKQIEIYGQLMDYTRKQLQCLKETPNICSCAGFEDLCTETGTSPSPQTVKHRWENRLKTYRYYIYYINSQFDCLSTINTETRLCTCIGGRKVCGETQFSNLFFPDIEVDGGTALDPNRFSYIENQLKCIESVKDKAIPCICKNGEAICEKPPTDRYSELRVRIPRDMGKLDEVKSKMRCLVEPGDEGGCGTTLSLSPLTLSYTEFQQLVTPTDKKLIQTYLRYILLITTQMECVKDAPANCLCSHGRQFCNPESIGKGRRDTAADYIIAYLSFISFIDYQINCLVKLKPTEELCACGFDKQCYKTPQAHRLVQLISLDYPASNDEEVLYTFVDGQVRCLAYMRDRTGKCTCFNGGLEMCQETSTKLPIITTTNQSICGITACPPNTRLVKKCPTCCPTCVQQYCVVVINGKKVVKQPGEKWSESACEKCHCSEFDGSFYSSCIKKQCEDIRDPDIEYKVTQQEDECCPILTPVGCKHEGNVFVLGSVIQRSSCETISCTRDADGTVIKKIDRTICEKLCPEGFKYQEIPGECCGTCEQIGCIVDDQVKVEGSTWLDQRGCVQYACKYVSDTFIVTAARKKC